MTFALTLVAVMGIRGNASVSASVSKSVRTSATNTSREMQRGSSRKCESESFCVLTSVQVLSPRLAAKTVHLSFAQDVDFGHIGL